MVFELNDWNGRIFWYSILSSCICATHTFSFVQENNSLIVILALLWFSFQRNFLLSSGYLHWAGPVPTGAVGASRPSKRRGRPGPVGEPLLGTPVRHQRRRGAVQHPGAPFHAPKSDCSGSRPSSGIPHLLLGPPSLPLPLTWGPCCPFSFKLQMEVTANEKKTSVCSWVEVSNVGFLFGTGNLSARPISPSERRAFIIFNVSSWKSWRAEDLMQSFGWK